MEPFQPDNLLRAGVEQRTRLEYYQVRSRPIWLMPSLPCLTAITKDTQRIFDVQASSLGFSTPE